MKGRRCGLVGCVCYLLFLLAGIYLGAAIAIPSLGGALHFGGGESAYPRDGAFWLTAAVAATSLLFFVPALVSGVRMLGHIRREEPFTRRELWVGTVGVCGCLLPALMLPDATLEQYPMMQPKWPPLPSPVERYLCLQESGWFSLFFLLFLLSLAALLVAYLGYGRRAGQALARPEAAGEGRQG